MRILIVTPMLSASACQHRATSCGVWPDCRTAVSSASNHRSCIRRPCRRRQGKAVVTTATGGRKPDIAGNMPPLAVAQDAREIADQVVALLAHDDARRRLG